MIDYSNTKLPNKMPLTHSLRNNIIHIYCNNTKAQTNQECKAQYIKKRKKFIVSYKRSLTPDF